MREISFVIQDLSVYLIPPNCEHVVPSRLAKRESICLEPAAELAPSIQQSVNV